MAPTVAQPSSAKTGAKQAPPERPAAAAPSTAGKRPSRRRKTSHLKLVPEGREQREAIRQRCGELAARLDKSQPLTKEQMEAVSRAALDEMGLPEGFLGWTMVLLASEFWKDQVAATPPERRLLLLPHCLKHAEGCPADYDQFGLDCKKCGACSIADFRTIAEEMGYKVLVAEGSPIVLKIVVSGYVDAILGVACLNVLEKSIDKILLAGIPCMAVPLLSSDCRNTSVDEDWVHEMINVQQTQAAVQSRTYVHLLRAADTMFEPDRLRQLAPPIRSGVMPQPGRDGTAETADPVAATEAIAYDFLAKGGKHSRPFVTLAAYDALSGAHGTLPGGDKHLASLPDAVMRTAMAIEIFHKASLVHDDIEDDDEFRYGDPTIHRRFGTATAINVGDYLIGMGYRMVGRETEALGADVAADILNRLADAHMKLSEGQGAELLWRDGRGPTLKPVDALKIYALKTSPAFEVALYAGVRLAGAAEDYSEPIKQLAKHLGVAFQILNDLKDFSGDDDNKLASGSDLAGRRPTLLWALAAETLTEAEREDVENWMSEGPSQRALDRVRELYEKAGVFEKAHRLVDKFQDRAEAVADALEPDELRRLVYYLIDTVLDRPPERSPEVVTPALL